METKQLDLNNLCKQLEDLSLFELSRLHAEIYRMLKDDERILAVKQALKVGMKLTYFNSRKNKLVDCEIAEINISKLKPVASEINVTER